MRSIRYLLKNSKLFADFSYRKEHRWIRRWVPKGDPIHNGSKAVRIVKVVSIPETIEYETHLNPNQVTLAIEFDNESIGNEKATSIVLDTSTLGKVNGTAKYNELSIGISITVVAPPEPEPEESAGE